MLLNWVIINMGKMRLSLPLVMILFFVDRVSSKTGSRLLKAVSISRWVFLVTFLVWQAKTYLSYKANTQKFG